MTIPWPTVGANFFPPTPPDWRANACVNWQRHYWHTIAEGFKRSAELALEHVLARHTEQDTLVYPIIFLYRHYVEVRLKALTIQSKQLLELDPTFAMHHDLMQLWQDLRPRLAEIYDDDDPEDLRAVDGYIQQLATLDRTSYAFRYPVTKSGAPALPDELRHVNLRVFRDRMRELSSFLDACAAGVSEYLRRLSY